MVSLENEYYTFKQQLENEKNNLKEFESIKITEDNNNPFSIEERIASKERGIKSCQKEIQELEKIFQEVKEELTEYINNGGEVSESTIKDLRGI